MKVITARFVFLSFIILTTYIARAQSTMDDITGAYNSSSNDPHGGSSFIVMPDHHFVVAYFGGILKGTWQKEDDLYHFVFKTEPRFVLYGRKRKLNNDTTTVSVKLDGNKGFAVRFNANKKDQPFLPIFNEDANCYSYPYVYKQTESLKLLDIVKEDSRDYAPGEIYDVPDIHRFLIEEPFDEFILAGLPDEYSEPRSFTATFKNNQLIMNGSEIVQKSSEINEMNDEDLEYCRRYVTRKIFPNLLTPGSKFFPHDEDESTANLSAFTRINEKRISSKGMKVSTENLFTATCQD